MRLTKTEKEVGRWKDGETNCRKSILESEGTKECILEDDVVDDGDDNDDDDDYDENSENVKLGE